MTRRCREAAAAVLAWVALLTTGATATQGGEAGEEFLILQLRLRSHVLADALPALAADGRVFLPLGAFCAAVEFPVKVDAQAQTARGWFRTEDQTLELDGKVGHVTLAGVPDAVTTAEFRSDADDLYLTTEVLERWFELTLEVDRSELQVQVRSARPFPREQRLEREARRAQALAGRRSLSRAALPAVGAAYGWLSWPFADLSLAGSRRRDADKTLHWRHAHSLRATADLAKMTGEVFATGDDTDGLSDLQLRLSRRDPQGGVLGIAGVTELVAGDLFSPPSALVARSVRGRGAVVSTFPLDRPDEFDRTTIRGPAPPHWEAELLRGGALLDVQVVGGDGHYAFADVPVLFGRNEFEVVLYGPQGQERRVPHPLYVGPGLIEPGGSHLRLSLSQHDTPLVATGNRATGAAVGEPRLTWEGEYGLTQNLSLAASMASLPIDEAGKVRRHDYLGAGTRATLGGLFTTLDGAWDVAGGGALQGAAQGRWGDTNWFAEHGRFWGFCSEQVADGDPVALRTRLRAEWGTSALLPFSVGLEAGHEKRDSGSASHSLLNRLSTSAGPLLATHRITWRRATGGPTAGGHPDQAHGTLLLSTLGRGAAARGELAYRLAPAAEFQSVALSGDLRLGALGGIRARCGRSFADHSTTASLGWNRSFSSVAVGITGEAGDAGTYTVSLSATFSLGRDPTRGGWTARAEPLADKASATVRVALDRNRDGQLDPGDAPLEGVRLQVNGRTLEEIVTDRRGEAFLPYLPAHRALDLTVDEASLGDPYWVAMPAGQRVLLRPGAPPTLEFLVQETGEIEGALFLRTDEEVRAMSGVKMQLLDASGRVVQEVPSAYDGFYLFQRIPLGRYTVGVEPELVRRARLQAEAQPSVVLTSERAVAVGVDLVLESVEQPATR